MKMKEILIVGAGDLGKEAVWLVEDINRMKRTYLILGFLDDDREKTGKEFYGYKVLGTTELLEEMEDRPHVSAVLAIQDGTVRKRIVEEHKMFRAWETLIHPTAVIARTAEIGKGSLVFPNVTVSVDSILGKFGLYYLNATVSNDCVFGDYISVMTGATVSEHVRIGEESCLSAGSCIYPHKTLGCRVKTAAGAIISRDYVDDAKVGEKNSAYFFFK